MKLIGCLVLDIGGRCILALSKELNCSRKFVRKSRDFVINNCQHTTYSSTWLVLVLKVHYLV